ncbi:MAG: spore coat protein CotH, partial [Fibrobacter sp.]|nr:spore coat protein CotH [Fibrobacter sp.]
FVNRSAILYSSYVNSEKVTLVTNQMAATIPSAESDRDMKKFNRDELYYQNSCGKGFSVTGSCLKEWSVSRDPVVRKEYRSEYGLGEDIAVGFTVIGDGEILVDEMPLPTREYIGSFFSGNAMLLTAKGNGKFLGWEDGSTENPRLVVPTEGALYFATFEQSLGE